MTTRFHGGPADGKVLCMARAPVFLRVVVEGDAVDALDLLDDEPKVSETLHAYRKVSDDGTVHVDGRDASGKRFGRWYACATYRINDDQPDDAVMRDAAAWRKWCMDNALAGTQDPVTGEIKRDPEACTCGEDGSEPSLPHKSTCPKYGE